MPELISLDTILLLLKEFGYFIFLPLTIIEGPIVTVIGGYLVSLHIFSFLITYVLAVAGDIIGDVIYYGLGRWGNKFFSKRESFLGIRVERARKFEARFHANAGKVLLLGKWTQSIGAPILFAAGMARMPLNTFLFFNTLGSLPKTLLLVVLGYYSGEAYKQISTYIEYAGYIAFLFIIVGFLVSFIMKRKRDKLDID